MNKPRANPLCECGGNTEKSVTNVNFELKGKDWYKGGFNGKGEH
jgi:predicted nucleic acid-binding Zn ribbon protein